MTSTRLVGLVRIGLVAASLAFAGGASLGSAPVAAGESDPIIRVATGPTIAIEIETGLQFDSRCDRLRTLATGASKATDPKQAHDFRRELIELGCL